MAAAQELQWDDDFAIRNFAFLAVLFQPDFLTAKKTKWMADFLDDQASSPETRVLSLFEAMWRIRRYHSFLIAAKAPPPPEVTPKTSRPISTNFILPCQVQNIRSRIEVRVKRRNPSKKKGTIGKQLPDIALELREVGNDTVLATSKSKGKKDCAVFDTNYRMQKGDAGLEEYVRETERLEYLGGVTYVINAYNRCKDYWQAPVCQKQSSMKSDQSGPLDFDDYYDELPETHKGKYYGEWHGKGMVPFYLKHAPRLQAISPIRVEKVLHTVTYTFGSGDTWVVPKGPMNLFSNDDACWTLLNTMFTLDPDWDVDAGNRVLDWTKLELAKQSDPNAMVRVLAIDALSISNPPNLT